MDSEACVGPGNREKKKEKDPRKREQHVQRPKARSHSVC
jgi:hypothetical protein